MPPGLLSRQSGSNVIAVTSLRLQLMIIIMDLIIDFLEAQCSKSNNSNPLRLITYIKGSIVTPENRRILNICCFINAYRFAVVSATNDVVCQISAYHRIVPKQATLYIHDIHLMPMAGDVPCLLPNGSWNWLWPPTPLQ